MAVAPGPQTPLRHGLLPPHSPHFLVSQGVQAYSPRTTSLTVQRAMDSRDNAEEQFFRLLESEMSKVGHFTSKIVNSLRERLFRLQSETKAALMQEDKDRLLDDAQHMGDEFLQLEKYVNLNYLSFHKILKKVSADPRNGALQSRRSDAPPAPLSQHDKNLPQTPCRQFYISHLHNQPWIQGNYSDLLMSLSSVYSELRGDVAAGAVEEPEEEDSRYSTTKYWVRMSDVSAVKHHILQHLPVYQYSDVSWRGPGRGRGGHVWGAFRGGSTSALPGSVFEGVYSINLRHWDPQIYALAACIAPQLDWTVQRRRAAKAPARSPAAGFLTGLSQH